MQLTILKATYLYQIYLAREISQEDNFLKNIFCKTLIVIITWYQKYLSPFKGFSCAYRVLHGGESCSQYVKRTLLEHDLMTAISMTQQRFQLCSTANKVLVAQQEQVTNNLSGRRKFIYQGMFAFAFPIFVRGRGGCPGCNACLSSMFEDNKEKKLDDG